MKLMKLIDSDREFKLKAFDRKTLEKSYVWLNDPEIQKGMNITYIIKKEGQEKWFSTLDSRKDYKIWSFVCNDIPIGAGGFRNITNNSGELTCYIGDKRYWGTGKFLVKLLLNKAKELGFTEVRLKVLHTNERAYNCYIKQGFTYESEDDLFLTLKIEIK